MEAEVGGSIPLAHPIFVGFQKSFKSGKLVIMSGKIIVFIFIAILILALAFISQKLSFIQIDQVENDQRVLDTAKQLQEKTDQLQLKNKNTMEEIYKQSQ